MTDTAALRAAAQAATPPKSRLDRGSFTVGDIQTMARAVGISPIQVRKLTEAAVFISTLPGALEAHVLNTSSMTGEK